MGADIIKEVIHAKSREEAETIYWKYPPSGLYFDGDAPIRYTSQYLKFYDEVFSNVKDALKFLSSKAEKWDKTTHMCKCGENKYAYVVVFAC